ncbi:MAG: glycine zipper domain-containing protein [Gemmatimonadota bacterium]
MHCIRIAATAGLAGMLGLAACGKGDAGQQTAGADSTRDLQLAQPRTDTVVVYRDTATTPPAAMAERAPAPASKPATARPRPKPVVPSETRTQPVLAEPAPAQPKTVTYRLAAGTAISASMVDSINSYKMRAGQTVSARVGADVVDDQGRVVIPAGAKVTLTIADIKWSDNKGDPGRLVLRPTGVMMGGEEFPLSGTVDVKWILKGRGVKAGDVAKGAGGAAAGAAIGGLLGKGTGAVIGAVVGGAAGTAVASQTYERDVIVAPGTPVTIKLGDEFSYTKAM